jgi:hypothetical protein
MPLGVDIFALKKVLYAWQLNTQENFGFSGSLS